MGVRNADTHDIGRLVYFSNQFPVSDPVRVLRHIHEASKDARHHCLARLLEEITLVVHEEVAALPLETQRLTPPFRSLLALAEDDGLRRGPLCGCIDGVLLCLVQLGTLIAYCETEPDSARLFTHQQFSTNAGMGIGLLVSTAMSLASTLSDVPALGAQVARIAFRMGVFVSRLSQSLDALDSSGRWDSWAHVVQNMKPADAQRELDDMYRRQVTAPSAQVFLSAHGRNSVTLSGPPSSLRDLFRHNSFFRDSLSAPLPVFGGLCHASHVYNRGDAMEIVGQLSIDPAIAPRSPVLSTSTGQPFPATNAIGLFQDVVEELLTKPIIWESVVDHIEGSASEFFEIFTFGSSAPLLELRDSLPRATSVSEVDMVDWTNKTATGPGRRCAQTSKLAIVGMSCRMPGGASNHEEFWDILKQGLDVHRTIPPDRFDVSSHFDPQGKNLNASHTPYGCFLDHPWLFDAPFFNMSPREVDQTDPMQRLALVTAYEALEQAGFVVDRTAASATHRVGTWYGQASDDYREVNTAQEVGTYFIPGGCRAFGPGRINYLLNLYGPSYSVDTACSSSLAAIQSACTALWNGEIDTAIAGGMNILTNSDAFAGLSQGHFLTKTPNACKTWDVTADGYCRGEGVASVVIKKLGDALADNDNILGVILSAGTNHSAGAVSITHPQAEAQSQLYRQVLDKAAIDPFDVGYIEMHGTGTQAGDVQEMTSVTDVFAPLASSRRRLETKPLAVGAVKSNIGHGEAVAGVSALCKVLLMFEKGVIPRHVGIKTHLNPKLPKDLGKRNLHIPTSEMTWPRRDESKRVAMVSSFSAAGGNSCLLLEEAPRRPARTEKDPRPLHAVTISAKSKTSLLGNLQNISDYLDRHPLLAISDVAYTTTSRRNHFNHRVAVAAADISDLRKQLQTVIDQPELRHTVSSTNAPVLAFTFTGQGAASKSSNLSLYRTSPGFRDQVNLLDRLAQRLGFPSIVPSIDGTFDADHDHGAVVTHLSLTCVQIALVRYWASLGVKSELVMGHSLGEFAALCAAGVLSASDAIFLVGTRARLLEEKCEPYTHAMLAVRGSSSDINRRLSVHGWSYEVACINAADSTTLSGPAHDIKQIAELLKGDGIQSTILNVAYAFHSAQTDPILDDFERIAKGVSFRAPEIPFVSPLLAKVICDDVTIGPSYLRRATREPCNFLGALQEASAVSMVDDDTQWVEIGPHPVCSSFIKSVLGTACRVVPSMRRDHDSWKTMTQSIIALYSLGVDIKWSEFHRGFDVRLVELPSYSWTNKDYLIPYRGDWALTKGNTFYDSRNASAPTAVSALRTSLVQHIIAEEISAPAGSVTVQSNVMTHDFLAAARGHMINDCAVVTSSVHADIAYTLGEYLTSKLGMDVSSQDLNITDFEVTKGLVAHADVSAPQTIQIAAQTANVAHGIHLSWFNIEKDGAREPTPFATATLTLGNAAAWRDSWTPLAHLIESRIEALESMAMTGKASRFSHKMAYTLFATSLVDYAPKYRGMQSVVMHDYEAFADIKLAADVSGQWTVPPHFIDSVAHLAGFIMNVTDSHDMHNAFCVTPGWQSMRITEKLNPGAEYRSYVRMTPTREDPSVFTGDVYVLRDHQIVAKVGGIKFRRYPRILLPRFFSATDVGASKTSAAPVGRCSVQRNNPIAATPPPRPVLPSQHERLAPVCGPDRSVDAHMTPATTVSTTTDASVSDEPKGAAAPASTTPSVSQRAVELIARQTGIDMAELTDDRNLADIGVDSLMGLVIAEKLRGELDIETSSSLFIECPSIGTLRTWLERYSD